MRRLPIADARALASQARALVDAAVSDALATLAPADQPACRAGCSWCCHVRVEVWDFEVDALAADLVETLAPDALAALRARVEENAARVAPLSFEAYAAARVSCALLGDDGRCSAYAVRPLACRTWHAPDADVCRDALEGRIDEVTPTAAPFDAAVAAEKGLLETVWESGHRPRTGELHVALAAALARRC